MLLSRKKDRVYLFLVRYSEFQDSEEYSLVIVFELVEDISEGGTELMASATRVDLSLPGSLTTGVEGLS